MKTKLKTEIEILNTDSEELTYKDLSVKFGMTVDQIKYIFKKHKKSKLLKNTYSLDDLSQEDIEYFKENLNNFSFSYFQKKFNTSEKVLRTLVKNLNLTKKRVKTFSMQSEWTAEELDLLKQNYKDLSISELSILIGKTEKAISKKRYSLNLVSEKAWSQEEDEVLRKLVNLPYDNIAFFLERSVKAVKHRISALDLVRSKSKETSIETIVRNKLDSLKISYIFNETLPNKIYNFRPDFRIESYKIIIEVNGDYWHSNPNLYDYEDLTENQKFKVEKDEFKQTYYESLGYHVVIIWESDIKNNLENVLISLESLFSQGPSNIVIY